MKITLLLVLLTVCNVVYGQRTDEQRRKALQEIAEKEKIEDQQRNKRVQKYLEEKGLERLETVETEEGGRTTMMIYDIDQNGRPIYISTFNKGAAVTTGADYLFDPGQSGFGLTGEGVQVQVWDGGQVRTTHVEFIDNNVIPGDGAGSLNFHANHVTGTIKARGVNENARGMAPDVILTAFDFDNDLSEIANEAKPDDAGMILSNHSYGRVTGWDRGRWFGDPNISDQEDWRFGFYAPVTRSLDDIAYNSPYYLMVWAASNDRGDSGDGSYPPDGPYDIIPVSSVAKNVLTVGAVRKIANGYQSTDDVVMSSFSSWGPTDDGRIKPDLVGAGLSIFSTFETGDEAYGNLGGTSMAAPNVTGTLALLQQLNKSIHGRYLKSSTLKGLAIHTTNEAGNNPGPDYEFGWGLMNGEAAGDLIVKENGHNQIIKEIVLQNGSTYELEITPREGSEVKVTICWTDLPGSPPAPALDPTDLMLVNDLDLRVNNGEEVRMPYVLNPENPGNPAITGDNFRDNVEKIEFIASDAGSYIVSVSHKGTLETGSQEFALIVSYESEEFETFYRIGANTVWSDPESWSLTSGGEPAMKVPEATDAVIFDNNSFAQLSTSSELEESQVFVLTENIEVRKLVITSQDEATLDINGNSITTYEGISADIGKIKLVGEGSVILKDLENAVQAISGDLESFRNVELIVDFQFGSSAYISGDAYFKSLVVERGALEINNQEVTFESLFIDNDSELRTSNSVIKVLENLSIGPDVNSFTESTTVVSEGEISLDVGNAFQNAELEVSSGSLNALSDLNVKSLVLKFGTNLILRENTKLTISDELIALGREQDPIFINSDQGIAEISLVKNERFCFDYLNIKGVNISGNGAFNAGLNSTIENALGWQSKACADVLFADFVIDKVCAGSVMSAIDVSNGEVDSWKWFLDGELVSESVTPTFDFPELRTYELALEITDSSGEIDDYTTQVTTEPNTIEENELIVSNGQLVSRQPSDSYQWYFNDLPLEGETSRTLDISGEAGTYFVVTGDGECFRKSPEVQFTVTSTDDDPQLTTDYNIYPNPAKDVLTVTVESLQRGQLVIELTDMSGRTLFSEKYEKQQFAFEQTLDTSELPNGLYVINILQGAERETKLIAIEK